MSLGNRGGRRPRKPTQLHILHGTYRKDRSYPDEPQPPPASLDPPPGMDGEALKFWTETAIELSQVRLFTQLDRRLLTIMAENWAVALDAQKHLGKKLIIKSPSGFPMVSPYWSIRNKALDIVHKGLIEFGMSPASRSRIKGTPEAPKPEDKKGVHRFLA